MVDRQARDEMVEWLDHYIRNEIDEIEDISVYEKFHAILIENKIHESDQTIRLVADMILERMNTDDFGIFWESKNEWNWVQRIKLLLKSDGELEWQKKSQWTWRQPVAMIGLLISIGLLIKFGFTNQTYLYHIPLGLLADGLFLLITRDKQSQWEDRLAPFKSISEMLLIYRRTQGFIKTKYTDINGLKGVYNVQSKFVNILKDICSSPFYALLIILIFAASVLISPIFLLALSHPEDASRGRVVLPAENHC